MTCYVLVYPHHLFEEHPALFSEKHFVLIEEPLFFTQFKFHKQKIAFHRIAMRKYEQYLRKNGKEVTYLECHQIGESSNVFNFIPNCKIAITCDLDDDWLLQRMRSRAIHLNIDFKEVQSPGFLNSLSETDDLIGSHKPYVMASFYKKQRIKSGILMHGSTPVGGKWSFDADNRKKLPKNISIPKLYLPKKDSLHNEIIRNVNQEFYDNPGELENLIYPVDFAEAKLVLGNFLEMKFINYGNYQDAILQKETFLFHSLLSPLLNSGLLTPQYVIKKTLSFAEMNKIPLNSLEGFIRQIVGWREFVRGMYWKVGRYQRSKNFWQHSRNIPFSFWSGDTDIAPVDQSIKNVLRHSYCHHIERLMILGNFMLLCEFNPTQVYQWFMEMFIDAYDWVMVPNVYGMSQYADGGIMTTKPYISSSNYIRKMSDYKVGEWCSIWDGLFWRFISKHKDFFASNPRLSVMTLQLDRMSPEKLKAHIDIAENYLTRLSS